jgi:molybdopterin-guanine dinucleotide biosynthesis protein A
MIQKRAMIVGLFVGGGGTRMGGVPKGLLPIDGVPIVERTARLVARLDAELVVVGTHPAYSAWAERRSLRVLADVGEALGPLGALLALLEHAKGNALALACDMPYLDAPLLRSLVDAPPGTWAPRRDGRWEPLCARYDAPVVLPIARRLADARVLRLQALLDECASELPIDDPRTLDDWDEPADVSGR